MQEQVYVVEEVMIRPSVTVDEIPEILPTKTADLRYCSSKKQSLRPIDFSLEPIFFHVKMDQEDACAKNERHNIPMVFLLANFLFVIEDVETHIE
jgi:hypothetical protein